MDIRYLLYLIMNGRCFKKNTLTQHSRMSQADDFRARERTRNGSQLFLDALGQTKLTHLILTPGMLGNPLGYANLGRPFGCGGVSKITRIYTDFSVEFHFRV